MKNLKKHLLVVLFLIVGFSANATDGLAVKVDKNQTLVIEATETYKNGILTLKDQRGTLLFRDRLMEKDSTYKKFLSLEKLPEGNYYLTFESKHSILTEVVTKTITSISIDEGLETICFKPVFKVDGKNVKFHLINTTENNAEVKVYNSSGEIISSVESQDFTVGKNFDFSRVPSGSYKVAVKIGEHTFTERFEL